MNPMFFNVDIKGDRLPTGTLCLTYDDGPGQTTGAGPGPRTLELAEYLYDQGIPATFFIIGDHAERHPGVLAQLCRWKHTVGNHTATHPGLVALASAGGNVLEEVSRTSALIRSQVSQPITFFRAPYGNWRETVGPDRRQDKPTSIVAQLLNRHDLCRSHVGPINWDISGHDYDYWKNGRSAHECAAEYLAQIERISRGIVLMHDSSEDRSTRDRNRACELTRLIVPLLKRRGYTFVGLDAIPQVQSAVRVERQCALLASNNRFVAPSDHQGVLRACSLAIGLQEQFGVVNLGDNRIALRASTGSYLSLREFDGTLLAESASIGGREVVRRIEMDGGLVALQSISGRLLRVNADDATIVVGNTSPGEVESLTEINLFDAFAPVLSSPP